MKVSRITGVSAWVVATMACVAASASPITVDEDSTYQFLDNASVNSVGITSGPRQQLGANCVVLNNNPCIPQNLANAAGTSGIATQTGADPRSLNFLASDLTSNHWATSGNPATLPDGAWTLTFSNGANQALAQTPTLTEAVELSFAEATGILQNGTTPRFSWALPTVAAGAAIDSISVLIRDVTDFRGINGVGGNGVATIIYRRGGMVPTTTSLAILPNDPHFFAGNTLQPGKQYALEIQLQDTRNDQLGGGFPNVLSQSRTYLNFSLQAGGPPGIVYLPSVDTSGAVPVYHFNSIPVIAGKTIYIDPEVAVGFDYQTAPGDPNFASVTLPIGFGDNLFDLWLWNALGSAWFDTGIDLEGGEEHLFATGGVDRFRITGIEPEEFLDPYAAGAFTTGVSFVADGSFSGTMTPLISTVPEAPTLALVLVALLGLSRSGSRARLQSVSASR